MVLPYAVNEETLKSVALSEGNTKKKFEVAIVIIAENRRHGCVPFKKSNIYHALDKPTEGNRTYTFQKNSDICCCNALGEAGADMIAIKGVVSI